MSLLSFTELIEVWGYFDPRSAKMVLLWFVYIGKSVGFLFICNLLGSQKGPRPKLKAVASQKFDNTLFTLHVFIMFFSLFHRKKMHQKIPPEMQLNQRHC